MNICELSLLLLFFCVLTTNVNDTQHHFSLDYQPLIRKETETEEIRILRPSKEPQFYTKINQLSHYVFVFLQSRLSRIHILVDITGKTNGKRFKSNVILWNPATSSRSKCMRSILSQGGSVRKCEKDNSSGPSSSRPSVLEYLIIRRSNKYG